MPQDLLSAALSESGIGDLASFDESDDSFFSNDTFTDSQPVSIYLSISLHIYTNKNFKLLNIFT